MKTSFTQTLTSPRDTSTENWSNEGIKDAVTPGMVYTGTLLFTSGYTENFGSALFQWVRSLRKKTGVAALALVLSLIGVGADLQAQTYTLNSNLGSLNTCGGTFVDEGGSGGSYGDSRDYTVTFCSNNGANLRLLFSAFELEQGYDYLYIYNGNNASAPQVAGSPFTGTNSPGTITASGTCLTVRFISDGSVTLPGWLATVSCVNVVNNCSCPGNLIENPGFESGSANWSFSSSSYRDFYSGYDDCGLQSTRITRNSGTGLLDPAAWQQENGITPGATYTLNFDAATHRPSNLHRVYLRFYNSSGTVLAQDYREADHDVDTDGKLRTYTLSLTAPAGTSYARVVAVVDGDWIKLDNVCLTRNTCNFTSSIAITESSCNSNDGIIQGGHSATLAASANGGVAPYNYNWSNGLGSGASKTVNPTATTNYTVTITDGGGCTSVQNYCITVANNTPVPDVTVTQAGCGSNNGAILINNITGYFSNIDGGPWTWCQADYTNLAPGKHTVCLGVAGCNSCLDVYVGPNNPDVTIGLAETSCVPNDNHIRNGSNATLTGIASGAGGTVFNLRAVHSGKCVDVPGASSVKGENMIQYTCHGGTNQQWLFIPVGTGIAVNSISDGRYYIQSVSSKQFLFIEGGGTANGTRVEQTTQQSLGAQWDVASLGGGQFRITNVANGKVLEVAGVSTADNAAIQVWDFVNGNNQKFFLDASSGYTYSWSNGLGAGVNKTVNPTTTTNYSVTVTAATGCTDNAGLSLAVTNVCPDGCSDNPTFTMQSPTLVSGSAGQVGAIYRFSNITPGVDARMTIVSKSHADIQIYDMDIPESMFGGYDAAFQPIIDYNFNNDNGTFDPAGDKKITFRVDFVQAGSTTPTSIPNLDITALDVDGNGYELREFFETSNYNGYYVQTPTTLTFSGLLRATGDLPAKSGIDETALDAMMSYEFKNVSSITFSYGASYNGLTYPGNDNPDPAMSGEKRLNSLQFKCYSFNTPIPCPEVSITISGGGAICSGGVANMSATVAGGAGACNVQWQISTDNITWNNIAGATGLTYVSPALTSNRYYRATYWCDGAMCPQGTSNVILVDVKAHPQVSVTGGQASVCVGTAIALGTNVTGGAGTTTYQWQSSTNNNNWVNVAGATGSTYNAANTIAGTTYYRVQAFSSGNGCNSATAASSFVEVNPTPQATVSNGDATVCRNSTHVLNATVTGGVGALTYQWQNSPNNSTWVNIPGATASNYTVPTTGLGTQYYRVIASSSVAGCGSNTSASAFITVINGASIVTQATPVTICHGGTANLNVTVTGQSSAVTYQWQGSPDGVTFSDIAGANGLTLTTPVLVGNCYFRLVINDCNGITYSTITLVTVVGDPGISTQPSNASICTGGAQLLSVVGTGGTPSLNYQWQSSTDNITFSNIAGANTSSYNTGTLTGNTYYRVVLSASGNGCDAMTSAVAMVTVVNDPAITATPSNTIVCVNDPFTLNASIAGGTGGVTYQWERSLDSISWTTISGATNSSYSATPTNVESYFYRVRITPAVSGCGTAISAGAKARILNCNVTDCENPFTATEKFNVFVRNGVSMNGGEIEGNLAMGGSLTLNGTTNLATHSIGTYRAPSETNPSALIIGGQIVYTSGSGMNVLNGGWMKLGTTAGSTIHASSGNTRVTPGGFDANPKIALSVNQSAASVTAASGLDFNTRFTELVQNATNLSTLSNNVTLSNIGPGSVGIALAANQTNVLNLTGAQINSYAQITFNNAPSATQPLIININAPGAFTWNLWNIAGIGDFQGPFVIYNFYNATALTINSGNSVHGSIIAPNANFVKNGSGNINGQVVANSFVMGAGEVHYYPFNGTLNQMCCSGLAVTANVSNSTICTGGNASLTANVLNASGALTYQWQSSSDNSTWTNIAGATSANYTSGILTSNMYFRVVLSQEGCTPLNSNSTLVTVVADPSISAQPVSATICTGGTQNLSVSVTGGTASKTYQWRSSTDNVTFTNIGGATSGSYTTPALTATTYYQVIITDVGTGCGAAITSATATVTVVADPSISAQPISATICTGGTQNLSVSVTGGTASKTYQWRSSTDNVTFTNIGGATSASYTTPALTTTTYYQVIITDSGAGCGAAITSATATVTVVADPSISAQPVSATICTGGTQNLTVNVSGGTASKTYQWRSSTDNVTFTNIAGATGANYTTPALTATTYYQVIITDSGAGCGAAITSATATVTVVAGPTISAQPVSATICTGGTQNLSVSVTGGTASKTYQWRSSTDNVTFTNIGGATSASYTTPALTTTTYYQVIITDSGAGCGAAITSATATVTVVADPSISAQPISATICTGGTQNLSVSVTGGTASKTYQWRSSTDNVTFTNIGGASSASYTTPALTTTTYYQVIITDSGAGCGAAITSATATVTVVADPSISAQPVSATICTGGTQNLSVSVTGGTASKTYQWRSSTDNVTFTNIAGATSANYTTPVLTATTYYQVIISDSGAGCGAAITSATATVTVVADPSISAQPVSATICTGGTQNLTVSVSGGTASKTYQWRSSTDNVTFTNIAGATGANYTTPALTATTYYQVIITDSGAGCGAAITSATATVTVVAGPSITAQPISATVCVGGDHLLTVAVSGGTIGKTYQWSTSTDNVTFVNIPGATTATYQTPVLSTTTYYKVAISDAGAGCNGAITSSVATVTVVPDPTVTIITNLDTVCSGGAPTLTSTVTGGTGTTTYQWEGSADGVNYIILAGENGPVLNRPLLGDCYLRLKVYTTGSGCTDSVVSNVVFIRVLNIIGITSQPLTNATVCIGGSQTLSVAVTGGTNQLSYQWQSSTDNSSYIDVPGATAATLITPGIFEKTYFRVFIEDAGLGCGAPVTSAYATIDVDSGIVITTQPLSHTICEGNNVTLSVATEGGVAPITYQWQASANNIVYSNIPGATNTFYTTPALNTTTYYRVIVRSSGSGCNSDTTIVSTIAMDKLPPVLVGIPADITVVNSSAIPTPATVTATDNVTSPVPVTYNQTRNDLSCGYELIRTWTATDNCNNVATGTQKITVSDNQAPVLVGVPADVTVANAGAIPAVATVTATDDLTSPVPVTYNQTRNDLSCGYELIRTWTATDGCSNVTTGSQKITVGDNAAPVLVGVPADITVANAGAVPAVATVTATDDLTSPVPVNYNQTRNDLSCGYELIRTWTATDGCGNVTTGSQKITVGDNAAPVLVGVPADVTVTNAGAIPAVATVTATDDLTSPVPVTYNQTRNDLSCGYELIRTWRATDGCGNVTTGSQKITVGDNAAPVLVGVPADVIVTNAGAIPAVATVTATDDLTSPVPVTYNQARNDLSCGYELIRTWRATDACGNVTTGTQKITVSDNQAPVLVGVPADVTVVNAGAIPAVATVTATDDLTSPVPVTYNQTRNDLSCGYELIRTWRATDGCGNVTTATQKITVGDNQAPVLVGVPADVTVTNAAAVPAVATVTATDDLTSPVPVTSNQTRNDLSCGYELIRTWRATDGCGNVTTGSQKITVGDNAAPVLVGVPADVTVTNAGAVPAVATVTATDDLTSPVPVTYNQTRNDLSCGYELIRTWRATDACGNVTTGTQKITVSDNQAPVLVGVPADITVANAGAIPAVATVTATDDLTSPVPVTYNQTRNDLSCGYELIRTWRATDGCGNVTTGSQKITVGDNAAPVLVGIPADITVNNAGAIPAVATVTATDDLTSPVPVTYNQARNDLSCGYELIRTWTATDGCGNQTIGRQKITVGDNAAPVLVGVPADVTVTNAGAVPAVATVTATDDLTSPVTVTYNQTRNDLSCGYELIRTWRATDACGNVTTGTQKITVGDNAAPVLVGVPADVTVANAGSVPAVATVTAMDDLTSPVPVTYNQTRNDLSCGYELIRTWRATDACGNVTTGTQKITVSDNQAPVLVGVPADITVANAGAIPAVATVTATDDLTSPVPVTYNQTRNDLSCGYELIRTWRATDGCGNVTTGSQKITVGDNAAPVLVGIPADITVNNAGAIPAVATVTATDDLTSPVSVTYNQTRNDLSCGYELIRTWRATDGCGNVTTGSQKITVGDNAAPVLVGVPADVTVANAGTVPAVATVTATDDLTSPVPVTYNQTRNDLSCGYELIRTWRATDGCGNITTGTQKITVGDNQAPVLVGVPTDVTVSNAGAIPAVATVTATDDLTSPVPVTYNQTRNDLSCGYELIRTWRATDACGNVTTGTQKITVSDNQAPVLIGVPADVTVANAGAVPAVATVTATDDLTSPVPVTYNQARNDLSCGYELIRTWTATDGCGNVTTGSQKITVGDNAAPVLVGVPADVTVANAGAVPAVATVTATDDLTSPIPVTYNQARNDLSCGYELIRTWTATDGCGNQTIGRQKITVGDNAAPVLVGVPADITVNNAGAVPAVATVTATDDLTSPVPVTYNQTRNDLSCGYELVRTWTATDGCGNQTIGRQKITVGDNAAPVLVGVPADITVNNAGAVPAVATVTATDDLTSPVPVTYNQTRNDLSCGYQLVRTWRATDACGNVTTGTQKITVGDNAAPVLVGVPADITVNNAGAIPAPATVTATDDLTSPVPVSYNQTRNNLSCGYELIRTWSAIDGCGNTTVATQLITVGDNTVPVLVGVPADITVVNTAAIPSPANVTATDDITSPVPVTYNQTRNNLTCGYELIRTWTATDGCGNRTTASQKIKVGDNKPPVLSGVPADVTVACNAVPAPATVTGSDDLSSNVTIAYEQNRIDNGCNYQLIRTWTGTDACGNTIIGTQTISVVDTEAPQFVTVPADITVDITAGEIIPAMPVLNGTDNCTPSAQLVITKTESAPGAGCEYDLTRTFTITDACGNKTTKSQKIHVYQGLVDAAAGANSPVCNGDPVQFMAEGGDTYQWTGPNGFTSTLANPQIKTANPKDEGLYYVVISKGSCTAEFEVEVKIMSKIALVINGKTTYCSGETITLTADGGSAWIWSGPNGFKASTRTITIPNIGAAQAGTYSVTAMGTGCPTTRSIDVSVNILTVAINGAANYCEGGVVQLTTTLNNPSNRTVAYQWTGPNGFTSNGTSVNINNAAPIQSGTYSLTVNNGLCTFTATRSIRINGKPNLEVLSNSPVCQNDTLKLWVIGAKTASWSGPKSFVSDKVHAVIPNATIDRSGWYNVTYTDSAGCSNVGKVNVTIGRKFAMDQVVVDADCTTGGSIDITLTSGSGNYRFDWLDLPASNDQRNRSNLSPGNYQVEIHDLDFGCVRLFDFDILNACGKAPLLTTDTMRLTTVKNTSIDPIAIATLQLPGVNHLQTLLVAPAYGTYSVGANGTTGVYTPALNFVGTDRLAVVIKDHLGFRDTTWMVIRVVAKGLSEQAIAVDDEVIVKKGQSIKVNVLYNDLHIDGMSAPVIVAPAHSGSLLVNADKTIQYTANDLQVTRDSFLYQVCHPDYGCGTAVVRIIYVDSDLVVFNGFSPNGDGTNDYFTIENIERYPNNRVQVFNSSGLEVFNMAGYNNSWDGKYRGTPVPPGTYFYVIDDGLGTVLSGYLEINY